MPCSYAWISQLACQWRDTVYRRSKKKKKRNSLYFMKRKKMGNTTADVRGFLFLYYRA